MAASVLFALVLLSLALAQYNVSVDDWSPDIIYSPASQWQTATVKPDVYFNGTSHWIRLAGATVEFNFRGSAIYYMADRNSDRSSFEVTFDGITHDGTAYSAAFVPVDVLFSAANLDPNVQHTIKLTNTDTTNQTTLVLDSFIYTVGDTSIQSTSSILSTSPGQAQSTSASSSVSGLSTQSSSSTVSSTANMSLSRGALAGIVVATACAGVLLGACIIFLYMRRRIPKAHASTVEPMWEAANAGTPHSADPMLAAHPWTPNGTGQTSVPPDSVSAVTGLVAAPSSRRASKHQIFGRSRVSAGLHPPAYNM